MKNKIDISLVIPFFNEEKNIVIRYNDLNKFLKSKKINYELIFVDDGSKDNSKKVITNALRNDKKARLISYLQNKGRGGAVATGFKNAQGAIIGYIDSDLEIQPKYILKCLLSIKNADGAIVSKHLSGSKVKTTFLRRLASKLFNFWARLILGSKVTDHQAGMKLFKRDVVEAVLPLIKEKGWLFDVEFLHYAQRKGFTINEVPIKVEYGIGKLRTSMISGFLNSLIFVVNLKLYEKN